MNSDTNITPQPNPGSPTGIHPGHPPQPGLPPLQQPSAGFIVRLFMIPGLIILVLVLLYLAWHWLFRGPATPAEFIKGLDDPNPEVRWRTAADLAQVLPRDEALRNNPGFALDIADRLDTARRSIEPLEKARLDRIAAAPETANEDRKELSDKRHFLGFLTSCSGSFVTPVGAPVLRELALSESKSTDPEQVQEVLARRRVAVFALALLGDNVRKFNRLPPEKQQAIIDHLEAEAKEGTDRGRRAKLALEHLEAEKAGRSTTVLGVDTALVECANSDDAFMRKQVALALTYWDGPKVEETLVKLLNDNGRGSDDETQRTFDARDVRYNAALALANRGSGEARQAFDTLKEMLDINHQQTVQKNPVDVVIATLKAVVQLKQRNSRVDVSSLRPAIDQLAGHNNSSVSTEAKKAQLALDQ